MGYMSRPLPKIGEQISSDELIEFLTSPETGISLDYAVASDIAKELDGDDYDGQDGYITVAGFNNQPWIMSDVIDRYLLNTLNFTQRIELTQRLSGMLIDIRDLSGEGIEQEKFAKTLRTNLSKSGIEISHLEAKDIAVKLAQIDGRSDGLISHRNGSTGLTKNLEDFFRLYFPNIL